MVTETLDKVTAAWDATDDKVKGLSSSLFHLLGCFCKCVVASRMSSDPDALGTVYM